MFSYIIGGPFADKYHPRYLMAISLMLTSIGGINLIYFHGPEALIFSYFIFGITTTLLMWGALIKLTHDVGGEEQRASAMGILDAGRGLTAAIISSVLIFAVAMFIEVDDVDSKTKSLTIIFALVSVFNIIIGFVMFFGLKGKSFTSHSTKWNLKDSILVLKKIDIWLLGVIILSHFSK